MLYPAKNFGPHCTVEIVAYSYDEYPKTTVYGDNIVEAMDLAEEFYAASKGIVEVCEMVDGRWKLSYIIEPFWGAIQERESDEEVMERWMNGDVSLYA